MFRTLAKIGAGVVALLLVIFLVAGISVSIRGRGPYAGSLPGSTDASHGASAEAEVAKSNLDPLSTKRQAEETAKHEGLRWTYDERPDQMGKGTIKLAKVLSLNEIDLAFPYSGEQRAGLLLRNHPRRGKNVLLTVERGQFHCSLDCRVSVRFGDDDAIPFRASAPDDGATVALFLEPSQGFVSSLRKVPRVRIEAEFFQQGTRVFEFDVSGLVWD